MMKEPNKIIFFDGICGLCNGFVDFIMRIDKDKQFQFSPLQSEFAKKTLPEKYTSNLSSVVVQIDGKTFKKAEAALAVFRELGGIWGGISQLRRLPLPLLDWGYNLVASKRYAIFGKRETCRLPTPAERERFIL